MVRLLSNESGPQVYSLSQQLEQNGSTSTQASEFWLSYMEPVTIPLQMNQLLRQERWRTGTREEVL